MEYGNRRFRALWMAMGLWIGGTLLLSQSAAAGDIFAGEELMTFAAEEDENIETVEFVVDEGDEQVFEEDMETLEGFDDAVDMDMTDYEGGDDMDTDVNGRVYVFSGSSPYPYSSARKFYPTMNENITYGTLTLTGDFVDFFEEENRIEMGIGSGNVRFKYEYNDERLNASEDAWHLMDDKSKKVDTLSLPEQIRKGALIVETSKDGETWYLAGLKANAFSESDQGKPFYETTPPQLANGMHYRVTVVYELGVKRDGKTRTKRFAEVYQFYLKSDDFEREPAGANFHYYSSEDLLTNTGKDNGYTGNEGIKEGDPHSGWQLGNFFISGFSDTQTDENGNLIFHKGDQDDLMVWFTLEQDIDRLDGTEGFAIAEDKRGYDLFFDVDEGNLGRGCLIVAKTGLDGVRESPLVTKDFLQAVAVKGKDIKLGSLDEGEYEIALDYRTEGGGKGSNCYQMYFKFKVLSED